MQQRSVPHWQRFLGQSSLHCICSKQGLPPNIPSFVWMPWRQSYTINLLGFGFSVNSCFALHLYSEGDWAHAGHSNTNPNAEVCETSHKEEATAPTKPAAFSVRTLPDNTAPFRKPLSLLPWNWKLGFSSNPRRLKKNFKKAKQNWIINIYEFDRKGMTVAPGFSAVQMGSEMKTTLSNSPTWLSIGWEFVQRLQVLTQTHLWLCIQ